MTSPDTSPVLRNLEGKAEYDVHWPWFREEPLAPGLTTVIRVKNEARSMPRVLPGVLAATDHVVVIDNQSDDGTADVAREVAATLGASDRLTLTSYPFDVSRCGLEHLWTPERSVHSLAYFYNWSFAQVSTQYSMKWDGDMVLTPEGIAILRDLGWQLTGDVLVTMPRHPLFVESDSVAYLDRGTSNIEPYVFPMAEGYGHTKAFEWELRLYPENITRMRLPEGLCVELKYLDADEFAHWTAPDSFANGTRQGRKRREWEVFHGLAAGDWRELGNIERIEAPAGVNIIDYVTEKWLPRSVRPVFADAPPLFIRAGDLPIDLDAVPRAAPGGQGAAATPQTSPRPHLVPGVGDTTPSEIDGAATPTRPSRPDEAATEWTQPVPDTSRRRLLLVAGSGRSGTSLLTTMLRELGVWVPQPEVEADASNERGFAESSWAVAFNDRLLKRERIEVSDARPEAWFATSRISMGPRPRQMLFAWLDGQFDEHDEIVIKDPRLSWFLGMWRAAGLRLGARPSFATLLRHPTQVVSSKSLRYPGPAGNTNRTAAWVNLMLFTERATRGSERVFVRYDDLLADWNRVLRPFGERLDLASVRNATSDDLHRVGDLIDPRMAGSHGDWADLGVTGVIQDLAEETWALLSPLAEPDEDTSARAQALDKLRDEYTALLDEAEGIAMSTIDAARPASPPKDDFLVALEKA